MIRIEERSVRLGISNLVSRHFACIILRCRRDSAASKDAVPWPSLRGSLRPPPRVAGPNLATGVAQKKGAQPRVPLHPLGGARSYAPRGGSLDEKGRRGKGCSRAPHRNRWGRE